jgi:phytoene dehydrogenase-like protein
VTQSGQLWLGKEVVRIRVERGKVVGVGLKNGTEIDSAFVISDTDYKNTFLRLVGPEALPPSWHRAISVARQAGSIIQVCVGLDAGKVNLSAFKEASRLIYLRNPADSGERYVNWEAEEVDPKLLASQELEVSLWGKADKRSSDGRKAAIVIRTEAKYPHFARYRSLSGSRIPAYQEYKIRLGHALIREIQQLLPGIEKAIEVIDVATPLTFEDQGGRSEGAVAGWSWNYEDFRDNQPRELIRTPIRGLYMAGYQAFSALFMGGVPTAIESGKRAAQAVMEKTEPSEEILIPLCHSL